MRIAFICASVDVKNAIVGDTLDRASTIAKHPLVENLTIVSLHEVSAQVINGYKVYGIGSDRYNRFKTLINFYKVIWTVLRKEKPDVLYLYMCPTLSPLLYPYKALFRFKIVHWFGHAIYTWPTRISLKYFSDLWFNSNKSMAPFKLKHLRLVGQGVRADQFFYNPEAKKKYDLVTVGRITPVKKIDQMLEVLKVCRDKHDKRYTLNICGDAFVKEDIEYKLKIQNMVKDWGLENQVTFSGLVSRNDMVPFLQQAKVFLFLVDGGVGKASLEGIACGLPVLISTPEAADFFGDELSSWFLCDKDTESVVSALMKILDAPAGTYKELCEKANALFLEKYTMDKFIDRIVKHIESEFY